MKTNFHNKNFALSLAFIMRFKVTRKLSVTLTNQSRRKQCNEPIRIRSNACYRRQRRENAFDEAMIGLGYFLIGSGSGLCFANQSQSGSRTKPKQTRNTFNTIENHSNNSYAT